MTYRSPRPTHGLLWVVLVLWATGCAPGPPAAAAGGSVRGSVAYPERMALPPDAVVEVRLFDVSIQDGAAPVIAQTTVVAAGREGPLPFELRYDPGKIQPTRWYALRATIRSGGRLLFTTDTVHRVITHGNPTHVDLQLVRVGERADAVSGSAARVEIIRANLAGFRAVHGASAAGDTAAAWTAYFDGATLTGIDETSNQGDDGTAENEYYFEGGALVAYVSRATRAVTDPPRTTGKEQVTLRLGFDASGGATEQSKTVDGRPAPIAIGEVAGVQARAAFLAAEVVRAQGPQPDPG